MSERIAVRVTPAAERAIKSDHPWVFESGIQSVSQDGRSGDLAIIFDRKKRFLAVGLYDPQSMIRVRILQQGQSAAIDRDWFQAKIAAAAQLRAGLLATQTTGYRLVHGENDGLPGLVVDRYGQTYVLKLYTAAWVAHLADVVAAVTAVTNPQRIILRLSRDVARQKALLGDLSDGSVLFGSPLPGDIEFTENGLRFEADLVRGQKTGFFLDQRENRARVEPLADGKSVLNVFAYTGGFSLYAARGGAKSVTSLEMSHPALNAAKRNFDLNPSLATVRHRILQGDAFAKLKELEDEGRLFDMVIIDPPSFAKQQSEIEGALKAYGRLVQMGLAVLAPEGVLVMASCSSRIEADEFFGLVLREARRAGRPLRELERSHHPIDHPIGYKEGAYLKCLFAIAP